MSVSPNRAAQYKDLGDAAQDRDFIKVIPLSNGKLLLALIDFPGKGVLPRLDKLEKRILAEECAVAQAVVLLHRMLENAALTPAHVQRILAADSTMGQALSAMKYHRCGQNGTYWLSKFDLCQISTFFETLVSPLFRDGMPAAAFVLLDPRTGEGQFLSRGHPLPIVIVRDQPVKRRVFGAREVCARTKLLVNSNLYWGFPDMLPPDEFKLEPGDHLIMMSDGLGEARLSTRSPHYPVFEKAVTEAADADTEPGFFDSILELAPDALFCPDGHRPTDPFPRLVELLDIFERRDDTAVLAYTQKAVSSAQTY